MSAPDDADFGVSAQNPEAKARGGRLKEALRQAGGNAEVSRRTGLPLSTLTGYVKGGELKLTNAIALAAATGVRLEWLATGVGPKSLTDPAPTAQGPSSSNSPTLFSQINADRLGEAYVMAQKALAAHGHRNPEPRRLVQVMVLIYDELNSDAESSHENDPQDSQPAIHEGS